MTNPISATFQNADTLAVAANLPRALYFSQDGGVFYLFAESDLGADWDIPNRNPLLLYVDSGVNPSFCQLDLCEKLRNKMISCLPSFTLTWDVR